MNICNNCFYYFEFEPLCMKNAKENHKDFCYGKLLIMESCYDKNKNGDCLDFKESVGYERKKIMEEFNFKHSHCENCSLAILWESGKKRCTSSDIIDPVTGRKEKEVKREKWNKNGKCEWYKQGGNKFGYDLTDPTVGM